MAKLIYDTTFTNRIFPNSEAKTVWAKAKDAVVTIISEFTPNNYTTGTGFFISNVGTVVTAAHNCVYTDLTTPALNVYAVISGYDGTTKNRICLLEVLGVDGAGDVAVCCLANVSISKQSYLRFGNLDKIMPGDLCYLVGNPNFEDPDSISAGIVRDAHYIDANGQNPCRSIFISAPGMRGNSGSPIMNSSGEILGIYTFGPSMYSTVYGGATVKTDTFNGGNVMASAYTAFDFITLVNDGNSLIDPQNAALWNVVSGGGDLIVNVSATRTGTSNVGTVTMRLYTNTTDTIVETKTVDLGTGQSFELNFNGYDVTNFALTWACSSNSDLFQAVITVSLPLSAVSEQSVESMGGGMGQKMLQTVVDKIVATQTNLQSKGFMGFKWAPLDGITAAATGLVDIEFDLKGIVVADIYAGSPVDTDGTLAVGDIIISIDGVVMGNLGDDQFAPGDVTWLKEAGDTVIIKYISGADLPAISENTLTLTLSSFLTIPTADGPLIGFV